jgi:soluble lytic murein transglycosylase-like protein
MAVGNWDVIYKNGTKGGEDRIGWGILSIKEELVYNGIEQGGMEMDNPTYGVGTAAKVKLFQKNNKLAADGEVGPNTAHALYKKRTLATEKKYGIEPGLLCKLKNLESADFPSCLGHDGTDRGQLQINKPSHPEVTDKQAFNFPFAIEFAAKLLSGHYKTFGNWDDALAAYNLGAGGCRKWIAAGRPQTNADGTPHTAAQYIRVVRKRVC